MLELLKDQENLGLLGVIGLFIFKEIWSLFRNSYTENTKALKEMTFAIQELKIELKNLKEKVDEMPKLKRDVDVAHELIRELRGSPPRRP